MLEFEFIDKLNKRLSENSFNTKANVGNLLSIGDDAALIGELVVAKDMVVLGSHFLSDVPIEKVIHRLFVSNISDVNAMGGVAEYCLLGLSMPNSVADERLIEAIAKTASLYNVKVIGGDTVFSQHYALSLTILGSMRGLKPLLRSGAKSGDIVFISRPVGFCKVSLEKMLYGSSEINEEYKKDILVRNPNIATIDVSPYAHYDTTPEVTLGAYLASINASINASLNIVSSCIDVSDGLGLSCSLVSKASEVNVVISAEMLPIDNIAEYGLVNPYEYALSSGEEYALCFTCSEEHSAALIDNVYKKFGVSIIPIGWVEPLQGAVDGVSVDSSAAKYGEFLQHDGSRIPLGKFGYVHK